MIIFSVLRPLLAWESCECDSVTCRINYVIKVSRTRQVFSLILARAKIMCHLSFSLGAGRDWFEALLRPFFRIESTFIFLNIEPTKEVEKRSIFAAFCTSATHFATSRQPWRWARWKEQKKSEKSFSRLNRPRAEGAFEAIVKFLRLFLHCHSIIISFCVRRHHVRPGVQTKQRPLAYGHRRNRNGGNSQAVLAPDKMHEIIQSWFEKAKKVEETMRCIIYPSNNKDEQLCTEPHEAWAKKRANGASYTWRWAEEEKTRMGGQKELKKHDGCWELGRVEFRFKFCCSYCHINENFV